MPEPLLPLLQSADVLAQLQKSVQEDGLKGFFVLKHSHRCVISWGAHERIEEGKNKLLYPVFELNVIEQRELSQHIAQESGHRHESPQLLFYTHNGWGGAVSHGQVDVPHAMELSKAAYKN